MDPSDALPWVWIDGRATPAVEARVSVFDRSFLYGDGLFESLRIYRGKPFLWEQHWQRLSAGAEFLGIRLPFDIYTVRAALTELQRLCGVYNSTARLHLSRGTGPRGYSPLPCDRPSLLILLYPAPADIPEKPAQWKLAMASHRQPEGDRLAAYKTISKLANVLAKREAALAGADEAIILNTAGQVAESASSNVFWIESATLHSPPVAAGALAGVTKEFVAQLARAEGWEVRETLAGLDRLRAADGVFLTNSGLGIAEATHLGGEPLQRSPVVQKLWREYRRVVEN